MNGSSTRIGYVLRTCLSSFLRKLFRGRFILAHEENKFRECIRRTAFISILLFIRRTIAALPRALQQIAHLPFSTLHSSRIPWQKGKAPRAASSSLAPHKSRQFRKKRVFPTCSSNPTLRRRPPCRRRLFLILVRALSNQPRIQLRLAPFPETHKDQLFYTYVFLALSRPHCFYTRGLCITPRANLNQNAAAAGSEFFRGRERRVWEFRRDEKCNDFSKSNAGICIRRVVVYLRFIFRSRSFLRFPSALTSNSLTHHPSVHKTAQLAQRQWPNLAS